MNIKRWIAVSVASLAITALFSINAANAQTKVAIVDVGTIFKQHPSFPGQLEALKAQADGFKAQAIKDQQDLAQSAQALQGTLKADSPDFKAKQTELAKRAAAMQVEQNGLMQKLMEREAMLHFETYQQVNALISKYCDERGIQLVLRYNNQKMDLAQPGSVMQRVNSSVIYHDPSNDITQAIIGQLSATANAGGLLDRR
ncbi:OmpH family outer membrane protein [Mariniblastus sp.]|nr:OmpH family outer membrane protein [Mariniblastus sp.]